MQRHVLYSLCRRAALAALFGFVASSALATGASPMEGTWGGADAQGRTAQITIVGDKVIGVFWEQDYHDAENLRSSKNGTQPLENSVSKFGRTTTSMSAGGNAGTLAKAFIAHVQHWSAHGCREPIRSSAP